jgi:PAS domain S-box-containing protein
VNEYRFRRKDGSYCWIHDELRVIYDDAGKPLEIVGSLSDINQRKAAEADVTAAFARLNHILASSPTVLYSFSATGENNPTFISDNVREVLGYEPGEYLQDRNFVPSRIHPDDAARVRDDLSHLFERGHLINEYRFLHKDGTYRTVSDEIKVIRDKAGNPIEIVGSWSDITIRKQVKDNIVSLLKDTSLFGSLDDSALRDIAAEANAVQLMGGMQLLKQGDSPDSFYLVLGGRIRTFVSDEDGHERPTSEIGRGEIVGETAILTGEPQLESARAIRDSKLLQFSKETFYRLVECYPETVLLLSKNIAIRYQREVRGISSNSVISTIAIIPAGNCVSISDFTKRLVTSLAQIGPTLHLDVKCMEYALAQENHDGTEEERILHWLHKQEALFQFVIYESTLESSPWSKRCIRQADRILSVAKADDDPALNLIEKEITSQQSNHTIARQELVLLHSNRTKLPSGTAKWLDIRTLNNHHHIVFDNTEHYLRLCRFLTGNAISLVLGGGGARGCAHVGLIRAMRELDVPIDAIGGTSIGSIVASAFALGFSPDEMLDKIDNIARESNPIKDITFPMVSLMTGGKLNKSLQKMYLDVQIEDLWVKYFAVSANLTQAQTEVHKRGPVWKSVRASMSIPGQIPPVVFDGELHVDGGVLNNLPVDIMREVCDGIIIANNVSPRVEVNAAGLSEITHSGWYYMLSALNPFSKKVKVPGILNTLMRSGMLSSIRAINASKSMADIYMSPPIEKFQLLDFGASHEIEMVGYKYALNELNKQIRDYDNFARPILHVQNPCQ